MRALALTVLLVTACGTSPLPKVTVDSSGSPIAAGDFGFVAEVSASTHCGAWVVTTAANLDVRPPATGADGPAVRPQCITNATDPNWSCMQVTAVVGNVETRPSAMIDCDANAGQAVACWDSVADATNYRIYAGHCVTN